MGTEFARPRSETRGERGRKALVRHTRNSKYTAHRWHRHSCTKRRESSSRLILFPTLSADRLAIALVAIGAVTVVGHQNAVCKENQAVPRVIMQPGDGVQTKIKVVVQLALAVVAYVCVFFVSHHMS